MTIDEKEALAQLRRDTRKYTAAEAKRKAAMAELADAIRIADDAGVARNEIQRVTGLARVTVYRVLGGAKE